MFFPRVMPSGAPWVQTRHKGLPPIFRHLWSQVNPILNATIPMVCGSQLGPSGLFSSQFQTRPLTPSQKSMYSTLEQESNCLGVDRESVNFHQLNRSSSTEQGTGVGAWSRSLHACAKID
jgi:hypothetical protein